MEPILEAKKLNLWYGPNHALHDVSIAIPEHEITAFIGPSGCGKSTFLRTLNRMNDLIPGVKLSGEVDFHAPWGRYPDCTHASSRSPRPSAG